MNSKKKPKNNQNEESFPQDLASDLETFLRKKSEPSNKATVLQSQKISNPFGFQPFRVDKYQVLEKIATGGMAEIYRAKLMGAENFTKHVAIKRILPDSFPDRNKQLLFITEAKLSSQLIHPNIVHTFDFIQKDDELLLVMEYIFGKTLRQLQVHLNETSSSLPVPIALFICSEIAQGLHYAHTRKDQKGTLSPIIHRDISPQNVMISYDGNVKILDFGIAKSNDSDAQKTKTGFIKGKLTYMAPEQALGNEINAQTEIYTTALVLYELLSGLKPRRGNSDLEILHQAQCGIIPEIEVAEPIKKVLLKALEPKPINRHPTSEKFALELKQLIAELYPGFESNALGSFMEKHFAGLIQMERLKLETSDALPLDSDLPTEDEILVPFHEFSKIGFLSNDSKKTPVQVPNESTFVKSCSDLKLQIVDRSFPPRTLETSDNSTPQTQEEIPLNNLPNQKDFPNKSSNWFFHIGGGLCFLFGLGFGAKFLLKNNRQPSFPTPAVQKRNVSGHDASVPNAPLYANQTTLLAIAIGDSNGSSFKVDWNDSFSRKGSFSPCEKAESLCKPSLIKGKAPYTINIRPLTLASQSLWNQSNCESISANASFDTATQSCRFSISEGETTIRFFK